MCGRVRTNANGGKARLSALLGCRFDDLGRRDEEHRKHALRRKIGAAASFAAVAVIAAFWIWDADYRTISQHCVNFAESWGSRIASARRAGGRVLRMTLLNGDGERTLVLRRLFGGDPTEQKVAERVYSYRADASERAAPIASAAFYNQTG
jgi:hypothetical protein